MKYFATCIKTKKDLNGNSRQGYLISNELGHFVRFVRDDYKQGRRCFESLKDIMDVTVDSLITNNFELTIKPRQFGRLIKGQFSSHWAVA